jgi:hypothetical protein
LARFGWARHGEVWLGKGANWFRNAERETFSAEADTIAIEINGDKRIALHVPAGSVITVESGPKPDDRRMLDIRWDGHKIVMFTD